MPLMMGVEMTESKSKTKETSSRTVNGVAGLNMFAGEGLSAQLAPIHIMIETAVAKGWRRAFRVEDSAQACD